MAIDRLTALDATFLHIEDGVSHMHIGSVGIFEGPPPAYDEVMDKIEGRLPLVPRYRQVVRRVPGELGRPVWVDDVHFRIDYHLRHSALPAPGGDEELRRFVGRVMAQQLDRTKPLWEIWVVEGLEGGRWCLLAKVHHCLVDGVAGSELMAVLMDLSPEPTPPVPDAWNPLPPPSASALVVGAAVNLALSPYEQLRAMRATLRVPRQALGYLEEVVSGLTSMWGALRPTARASLNGPLTPHRRWDWAECSVDDVKAIRKAFGGSFNDVVLTAITTGFRELLLARGQPTRYPVVSMVPVSVRPRDAEGRAVGDGTMENRISAMFADLPVGLSDPVEQLHALTEQMRDLKESHEAVAGEALTSMSGFAPPMLLSLATRLATKSAQHSINTITTNVPGPQFPLYLLGRRMERVFPYVPLAGQIRIAVAIFSYDGSVYFSVTADYDSTRDIGVLTSGIERGLRSLLRRAR